MLYQFALAVNNLATTTTTINQPVPFVGKYRVKIIQFDCITGDARVGAVIYKLTSNTLINNAALSHIVLYNTVLEGQNFGNHFIMDNVNFNGICDISISTLNGVNFTFVQGFILTCEIEKI